MSGFTYSIAVKVSGANTVSATAAAVQRLDAAVDSIPGSAAAASKGLAQMASTGQSGVSRLESSLTGMAARLGGVAFAAASLNKTLQMDAASRSILFSGGQEGADNIALVRQASDSLGLSLVDTMEGMKQWAGSIRGSKIAGEEGRAIFLSVAESTAVMGVTAEEQRGVFLALSQMMSKGKVSAEELRGQLGERMAGAFGIAAKAMGVTESQLNKMLETGQVLSEDFLPKFARQLHKEMGLGAKGASESAVASINRFKNSITDAQTSVVENLLPSLTSLINTALIPAMKWIGANADTIYSWGKAIFAGVVTMKLWCLSMTIGATATALYTDATTASAGATTLFGRAVKIANAVLASNPIGLVVLALGALASAFMWAYNTSDNFRGMMQGIVQVVIDMTQRIWTLVTGPLSAAFKVLSGDMEGARKDAEAWNKAARGMTGAGLAASYNQGWNRAQRKADAKTGGQSTLDAAMRALEGPAGTSAPAGGSSRPASGGSAADGVIKSGIAGITGGGPQNRVINLNNLVGELNINSATLEQGSEAMVNMLMQKLLQVLNASNQTQ